MQWCQIPLDYTAEKWHKGNYRYNTILVLVAKKVLFTGMIGQTERAELWKYL